MRTIVWFRGKDLRLADHAPLRDAVDAGEVVPLFVVDPYFFARERAARLPHRIQFLLDSLHALAEAIAKRGSRLVVVRGRSVDVVPRLAKRWRADRIVAHRWVEPFARERDARIAKAARLDLYEGETLHPPGTLRTGSGKPYAVFTQFARTFRRDAVLGAPLSAPRRLPALPEGVDPQPTALPTLEALGLSRNPAVLPGGEAAARARLRRFIRDRAAHYATARDAMGHDGTSRLSVDLKFGTLSPRQVWTAVHDAEVADAARDCFTNELLWREFAYSTLWDRPELLQRPFRPQFEGFPWRDDAKAWTAWCEGRTGYPVVDAAARQLRAEGFVHNRARMVAASFATKHLLIDYRRAEAHYLQWLTDGDWANNNLGWQWSAGCGCDAQPYFRVFNPVSQGTKHDPDGAYVRRWVPELASLPNRWIHEPWAAPAEVLDDAGIELGTDYPRPIVEHAPARARFLEVAKAHLRRA